MSLVTTNISITIPNIEDQLKKIDEVVRQKLIPAIVGVHIINDAERVMLSLPKRLGGLGLKIFAETAENEYKDSTRIKLNFKPRFLESTTTRASLEVTSKLNVKKEIKKTTTAPGNIR